MAQAGRPTTPARSVHAPGWMCGPTMAFAAELAILEKLAALMKVTRMFLLEVDALCSRRAAEVMAAQDMLAALQTTAVGSLQGLQQRL